MKHKTTRQRISGVLFAIGAGLGAGALTGIISSLPGITGTPAEDLLIDFILVPILLVMGFCIYMWAIR
jgi:hypothetical protein